MTPSALAVALVVAAAGGGQARPPAPASLQSLSAGIEALTEEVAPSIVQVMAVAYAPVDSGGNPSVFVGRQRVLGSGAILSADGYIITNAHVVNGAERVQVVLHGPVGHEPLHDVLTGAAGETVDARVVGTAPDVDLALLKVDATGLRPIRLADYQRIRQGELVFAFGSPEGLADSMTMGVVSAVARQRDRDDPTIYVQTDAPINPGNSGGPLVNVDGELVGVNTFILSQSGGSQGLGFAIPSTVVASAYQDLREYGRLRRGILGIEVQANSPAYADGLNLPKTSGVLVSDVLPDGPAAAVGLQAGDLISAIGGEPIPTVAMFGIAMSAYKPGDRLHVDVLRGSKTISTVITLGEETWQDPKRTARTDPGTHTVARLGIIGVDVTDDVRSIVPNLREPNGVFVAARTARSQGADNPLASGDVIHRINAFTIRSLDGLRAILDGFKPGSRVAVQIERDGRLRFALVTLER